jgi:hypothetical protein
MTRHNLCKLDRSLRRYPGLRVAAGISLCLASALAQSASTGSITGWVFGTNGKPLAGVIVLINARPDLVNPVTPFNATAVTIADGSFTLTSVPDGTYSLCPHPPTTSVVAPCNWSTEPRVTVTNGASVLAAPIPLQAAADLYIRVNDPNAVLAATGGSGPGAALMLAVRAPNGRVFPIPMTARDKTGFDHHLQVPVATNLVFMASSPALSLGNSQGQLASKGGTGLSSAVNIPSGQAQHEEVINIR